MKLYYHSTNDPNCINPNMLWFLFLLPTDNAHLFFCTNIIYVINFIPISSLSSRHPFALTDPLKFLKALKIKNSSVLKKRYELILREKIVAQIWHKATLTETKVFLRTVQNYWTQVVTANKTLAITLLLASNKIIWYTDLSGLNDTENTVYAYLSWSN